MSIQPVSVDVAAAMGHLPHAFPFRFVDRVVGFLPGKELRASYSPASMPQWLRGTATFPGVLVIEGLAQTTVLAVVLGTGPLGPGEIPLLGSVSFEILAASGWDEELEYCIRPLRLTQDAGVFQATATASGETLATGTLVVGKRRAEPDPARGSLSSNMVSIKEGGE